MKRLSVLLLSLSPFCSVAAPIRLGIIGADTSHAPALARLLANHPDARVVAAFKGGSPDVEASRTRVDRFAEELKSQYGVRLVGSIDELLQEVDGVLLLSVDGRRHLEQARKAFAAKKPVFIDKPLASRWPDVEEIARAAGGIPWFTSSALRYGALAAMKSPGAAGYVVWAPAPFEEHHEMDLSWYGIHGVELLFTLMGTGCEEVTRVASKDADVVVGRWRDGRLGTVQLRRPESDYGVLVFEGKGFRASDPKARAVDYAPLLEAIVGFFKTGRPPVPNEESLEIFAFIEAAQRSKAAGGTPVRLPVAKLR
ncbi:MAG: Gfo/Idh/MocA family oxidoreductase [Bryobacteraceae bacterium]|nr:Gfo/Idh/MocA family oxidoreductase [Bryobacteraceae bacterium]